LKGLCPNPVGGKGKGVEKGKKWESWNPLKLAHKIFLGERVSVSERNAQILGTPKMALALPGCW